MSSLDDDGSTEPALGDSAVEVEPSIESMTLNLGDMLTRLQTLVDEVKAQTPSLADMSYSGKELLKSMNTALQEADKRLQELTASNKKTKADSALAVWTAKEGMANFARSCHDKIEIETRAISRQQADAHRTSMTALTASGTQLLAMQIVQGPNTVDNINLILRRFATWVENDMAGLLEGLTNTKVDIIQQADTCTVDLRNEFRDMKKELDDDFKRNSKKLSDDTEAASLRIKGEYEDWRRTLMQQREDQECYLLSTQQHVQEDLRSVREKGDEQVARINLAGGVRWSAVDSAFGILGSRKRKSPCGSDGLCVLEIARRQAHTDFIRTTFEEERLRVLAAGEPDINDATGILAEAGLQRTHERVISEAGIRETLRRTEARYKANPCLGHGVPCGQGSAGDSSTDALSLV
jgi:hypothetical protein